MIHRRVQGRVGRDTAPRLTLFHRRIAANLLQVLPQSRDRCTRGPRRAGKTSQTRPHTLHLQNSRLADPEGTKTFQSTGRDEHVDCGLRYAG